MLTIILTRHGHTDMSDPDHYLGRRVAAGLSPLGKEQARALGTRLRGVAIDRVISSPLERARDTARIVAGDRGLEIEADERLSEFDYGGWEGMAVDEVERRLPAEYAEYDANPALYHVGGGENGEEASRRTGALIEYLLDWWGEVGDRTCLLVGHSSLNRVLLATISGVPLPDYRRRFVQDFANLTVLRWKDRDGGPLLAVLNDTSHYRGISGATWQ